MRGFSLQPGSGPGFSLMPIRRNHGARGIAPGPPPLMRRPALAVAVAALSPFASLAAAQNSPSAANPPTTVTSTPLTDSNKKPNPTPNTPSARRVPEGLNFANALLRDRRYDLAAKEYLRFLETAKPGPDANDARFGLASTRLFQADYAKARNEFEDFLRDAPKHANASTALYRIGECAYMLGDLAGARKAFETFTAKYPDHKHVDTAWPYLGDVCLRIGDVAKAREAYETSIRANPNGKLAARARFGLGRSLALLGELDSALAQFKVLIEQGGKDWADRAWLQTGQTEVLAGRDEKAVAAYQEVETAAPQSPLVSEARLGRAEALCRLGRAAEAEPLLKSLITGAPLNLGSQAAFFLGTTQLEAGDPQAALATFDDASARFSKMPLATALQFRAAEALIKLGKPSDAKTRFIQASQIDPKDPWADDALLRACRIAVDQNDLADIKGLVQTFETTFPNSPWLAEVHLIAAKGALAAKQPKEAIAILNAAIDADKPSATILDNLRYYLSIALRADGQPEKANEMLDALAKGGTGTKEVVSNARFMVAQGLMESKKFDEAIPALELYLKDHPDGEEADYALAHLIQAKTALDDHEGAAKALEQLAGRFPKSPTLGASRLRVAEALAKAKVFDRAAAEFKLAETSDDPGVAGRAKLGLGWVLVDANQPAEAALAFKGFVEANPQDPLAPDARLAQAKAQESAGLTDEAIATYTLVADLGPKTENAKIANISKARLLVAANRPADAADLYSRLIQDDQAPNTGTPPTEADPNNIHAAQARTPSRDTLLDEWGWALIDADKAAEADQVFGKLLNDFPNSPHAADARFNLAESANQSKNFDEVVRLLEPVVADNSTASPKLIQSSLYRLGRTFAEKKDWENAAKTLDRLLDVYKDTPLRREAVLLRGDVALERGDAAKADALFQALAGEPAAAGDPPGFASALARRKIQSLLALKKWNDVIEAADLYKANAPNDPLVSEADYAKGRALQQLAKWDEARACYASVIENRKAGDLVARAQFMIGETYFFQKNYHEAVREFLKVDLLYDAPNWQAAALLESGKAYEQLAQWADAAVSYEAVHKRLIKVLDDPGTKELDKEAANRLEALKGKANQGEGIAAEAKGLDKS